MPSVLGALVAITTALSSSNAAAAEQQRITSAYTKLDLNDCRIEEQFEAGSVSQCPGYAGIPVFVDEGDLRFDVSAGSRGRENVCRGSLNCSFNFPGKTVEWRLANGKPFAIIYRLEVSADVSQDRKKSSRLLVETVGQDGCRIANIDGAGPEANAVARAAADSALNGGAKCIDTE